MESERLPAPLSKAHPTLSPASLRTFNKKRALSTLLTFGYTDTSPLYHQYLATITKRELGGDIPVKKAAEFTANFILQTFNVVKLSLTEVFYIGYGGEPLYEMCQGIERLTTYVSSWYQVFFGFGSGIAEATKILVSGILPSEMYGEVDRQYLQIVPEVYWNTRGADIVLRHDLPPTARVFAKMFDTETEDANVFKVPPFLPEDIETVLVTYRALKDTPYYKWPHDYRWQCFKDWADGDDEVEFGMFSVLALPFMRPTLIRGSMFNVGEGHNGKSVLLGLATSLIGGRNTSSVSGNDLGKWDYLVDLQTTWFNCPNETDLTFLKEQTSAFKTISAHETLSIRKKFGDVSVQVRGNFPMVFNINTIPDFGEDAPAILSRMFVNGFEVDFEAQGRADKDYAKKTFLSDRSTIPTLVGMVLAFTHYYSDPEHLWEPSSAMTAERDRLRESATPQHRYISWLKKFFIGYTNVRQLKGDYVLFGNQEGESYDGSVIKTKSLALKPFVRHTSIAGSFYRLPQTDYPVERFMLSDKTYIRKYMGAMDYEQYSNSGHSLVYDMMCDYLAREDEWRRTLKQRQEERTEGQIQAKVLHEMWLAIDEEQGGRPYEQR